MGMMEAIGSGGWETQPVQLKCKPTEGHRTFTIKDIPFD
jgi:hypothetical protein